MGVGLLELPLLWRSRHRLFAGEPDRDHNDVEVTRRSADYRNPDPLSVSIGVGWNENTADGDFLNESEAAYTLDFNMAAGLTFSMNGSVSRRFSPFFKIRQWRSLRETPVVTLDAVPLSGRNPLTQRAEPSPSS